MRDTAREIVREYINLHPIAGVRLVWKILCGMVIPFILVFVFIHRWQMWTWDEYRVSLINEDVVAKAIYFYFIAYVLFFNRMRAYEKSYLKSSLLTADLKENIVRPQQWSLKILSSKEIDEYLNRVEHGELGDEEFIKVVSDVKNDLKTAGFSEKELRIYRNEFNNLQIKCGFYVIRDFYMAKRGFIPARRLEERIPYACDYGTWKTRDEIIVTYYDEEEFIRAKSCVMWIRDQIMAHHPKAAGRLKMYFVFVDSHIRTSGFACDVNSMDESGLAKITSAISKDPAFVAPDRIVEPDFFFQWRFYNHGWSVFANVERLVMALKIEIEAMAAGPHF